MLLCVNFKLLWRVWREGYIVAALVGSQEEVPGRRPGRQGLHHAPGGQKFLCTARSMSL